MPAVVDRVDVEGEAGVAANGHRDIGGEGGGEVPLETARAVCGREREVARPRGDVGAVASAVGDERHGARADEVVEPRRQREIAVGDDHMVAPLAGDRRDTFVDGAVEPAPWAPQHLGTAVLGPCCDRVVVAGDEHRERVRRRDHATGHRARQEFAVAVGEVGRESELAAMERLDGDEHGGFHDDHPTRRRGGHRDRSASPVAPVPCRSDVAARPADAMTEPMITTGVTGRMWRASVAPSGAVLPWEGRPLRWFVAAEDRWHVPDDEPTVRQIRIDGTAVAETRVRVPHGDVVQRVYSVPDADGITIIEVENESTMPVAIAFDHRDVLTERPIADVPVEGIELPAEAFVMPLGHTASIRVGIAHEARGEGRLPDGLPAAAQVARGWLTITDRASRFALPDGDIGASLAQRITAERCELALGSIPHVADDPAGFALALHEIVRMGERVDPWLPELVEAVEAIGPQPGWDHDVALVAAGRVLAAAGEDRARRDLGRILARRATAERPQRPPDGVRAIAWLESLFARGAELLPHDLPDAWLGQSIECYGVPTADTSSVSYAIRWHGARPAVLWEQTGEALELSAPVMAPDWRSAEASGEALWPPPPSAPAVEVDPSTPAPLPDPAPPPPPVEPPTADDGDVSFS